MSSSTLVLFLIGTLVAVAVVLLGGLRRRGVDTTEITLVKTQGQSKRLLLATSAQSENIKSLANTPSIEKIFYSRQKQNEPFAVSEVDSDISECDSKVGCTDPDRTCLHLSEPIRLRDGGVLQPNVSTDRGYCLAYEPTPAVNLCDPRYGATTTTVMPSGRLRTSCRCFWPSLFDQKDIFSDCSIVRACGGTGKLIHAKTRVPLDEMPPDAVIDIHEFECGACGAVSDCASPGKDPHTGLPSCVLNAVADRTNGLCLYEPLIESGETVPAASGKHTTAPVLAVKGAFVSADFAKSFSNSSTDRAYVPNPCAFDALSGESVRGECRLALTPSGTGYCEPTSQTVSTVVFDDDYLPNNGGRYSNACYKFTADEGNVTAFVAEYFVRNYSERGIADTVDIRRRRPPPLPAMSVEIEAGKLDPKVSEMLNVGAAVDPKRKILITQGAIPEDVESVPVPFDKATMSKFVNEHNDFVHYVPAKWTLFRYWAPVQTLEILNCDNINDERETTGFSFNTIETGEYEMKRQKHVVACREPYYDRRLAIVPNMDVNPSGAAYDADPTSAVLRFDKSDFIVRPYWYRSYVTNKREVEAYVSKLPSRPTPPFQDEKSEHT